MVHREKTQGDKRGYLTQTDWLSEPLKLVS